MVVSVLVFVEKVHKFHIKKTWGTFFRCDQVRSGEAHVSQLAVAASFADLESKGSTETRQPVGHLLN